MRAAHAAASQEEPPSLRGGTRLARRGSAAAGSSTAAPAANALPPSTPTGREASRLVMVDMLEFEPAGLRGVALSGGRTRADPPSSRKRRSMDARMQAAADQPQQSRAKGKQRQRAENWEEGAAPAGFPAAIEEEEDPADGHAAEQAAGHPRSPALPLRGSGAPAGGARDAADAADPLPPWREDVDEVEGPSDSDSDTGRDPPPPAKTGKPVRAVKTRVRQACRTRRPCSSFPPSPFPCPSALSLAHLLSHCPPSASLLSAPVALLLARAGQLQHQSSRWVRIRR